MKKAPRTSYRPVQQKVMLFTTYTVNSIIFEYFVFINLYFSKHVQKGVIH